MQRKIAAKPYSILFFCLVILVVILSIKAAAPPPVVKSTAPDSAFSAQRAFTYLQQIARAPHSIGTGEHRRVANYIENTCKQLGLTVETQDATATASKLNLLVAANVHNIIAYTKGTKPGKAILNIAHYDSQPNTPGAADDGIGVAALLETARAIKTSSPAENDIMFLFTDGEEPGLLGAKAFVAEDSLFKNVAVAMNWDFRGNKGIAVTYETSPGNGWIMKEYARGIKYPYGNSLAFEISKRLPNYVDFKEFKKAGATGFTSGMIDGFTSYHNMTDNLQNVDQGSLQQVGDNMLSMIKRLENRELKNTKAANVSYFNVFGFWFVYYPDSLNIIFVIITTLLFAVVFYIGFAKGKIKLPGFLVSILALPLAMAITYFTSFFLLKRVIRHYPLYTHFDGNNSYNSDWYFLSITLLSMMFFSFIYQFIVRTWGLVSSFAGILLLSILSMWAIYFFAPSASWLLFIPLLFLLTGFGWLMVTQRDINQNNLRQQFVSFISALPAVLLFAPLTYLLFVSFALTRPTPFISVLIVFIYALLYPVFSTVLKNYRWLLPLVSLVGVIFSLVVADAYSDYDEKHPLQTNVSYQLNVSDSTAHWISDFTDRDEFMKKFFTGTKADATPKNKDGLIYGAPFLSFEPPTATVEKDSSYNDAREITLMCKASRSGVSNMGIIIDDSTLGSVNAIEINNKQFTIGKRKKQYPNSLIFFGVSNQGFSIKYTLKGTKKLGITLFDRSIGLPAIKGLNVYPKDIIPAEGFNNNTTQVEKHFIF
ncbi:MAG: M20/M25/M40 family metallo-hydrolase [Ginsengibacter sp.]